MDMNKTFFLKKEERAPEWQVVDATDKVVGRLATEIADMLRGKNRPIYTPHTDSGDYVVVINAEKIVLTGNKMEDKEYHSYSGWIGGLKIVTARQMLEKYPERIIEHAVKGMLPDNRLKAQFMKKLKIYAGSEHPHKAQVDTTAAKKAA
jgi:large subunit ribosomal protein L13